MAKRKEVYKCELCGNIVEVLHGGRGMLYCCGQPMGLLPEKTEENPKHIPIIESTDTGVKVKVGAVTHPMEEKHFIEWIEVWSGDKVYRKFLNPGDAPEAEFPIKANDIKAREYCTIHGLWTS